MKRRMASPVLVLSVAALSGCGSANESEVDIGSNASELAIGSHLAGISDADFNTVKANFVEVEDVNDGLGPIFNEKACGNCHSQGAVGGAGVQIERRFGRFDNGIFNPLANEGGSLRQLFTLGSFTNSSGVRCNVPLEVEPADATVHNVGRLTTPLFGLGLVDAIPDSAITTVINAEPPAVRGTANPVPIALPDPSDSSQSIGTMRLGRFGWKAGVPNLVQFAADAYVNEMGITTQHCFKGTSITAFATESAPNGRPVAAGCDDNKPGVDDAVGSCAGSKTEIQDDVANFTRFMTFLAPPERINVTDPGVAAGLGYFSAVGCAGCHSSTPYVTPPSPKNGVPGSMGFTPYSDFALHDMGTLGDQIGNAGDSLARTRMMRTAPLWGARFRTHYLHDGRAADIATAIQAHDGQGATARSAFNALSTTAQGNLVKFVLSL